MRGARSAAGADRADAAPVVIVPIRWGQFISAGAAIGVVGFVAAVIGRSQEIQWSAIPEFLFNPAILSGVGVTLELTAASMLIGIALGIVLALMKMAGNPVLGAIATVYIWFFRGTPLLVQIFFWFNIALFVPELRIGSYAVSMNTLVTAEVAGLLALALHEAANMAEITRGGLLSVEAGQSEASLALGMTRGQAMRRIILPQAIRVIIPPTGNQAIGMLKASAAVSVIGMRDLLTEAQHTYARNFLVIELLFVAAVWYLAMTTVASIGQFHIERHFRHGVGAVAR